MDEAHETSWFESARQSEASAFTPSSPAQLTRASSQLERSRWSASTSSIAPSIHRYPTQNAHQSLPPIPTTTAEGIPDVYTFARPRTLVRTRHVRHACLVGAKFITGRQAKCAYEERLSPNIVTTVEFEISLEDAVSSFCSSLPFLQLPRNSHNACH